jgi:hypothetical protein
LYCLCRTRLYSIRFYPVQPYSTFVNVAGEMATGGRGALTLEAVTGTPEICCVIRFSGCRIPLSAPELREKGCRRQVGQQDEADMSARDSPVPIMIHCRARQRQRKTKERQDEGPDESNIPIRPSLPLLSSSAPRLMSQNQPLPNKPPPLPGLPSYPYNLALPSPLK